MGRARARRRAGGGRAACGRAICLFYRFFPRRGNRGDCTFDPQMPPSARFDGLPQLQPMPLRCRACQLGLYPIGLLHSAGRRNQSLEVACRMANVQRAGDGTSMFVALWEYEVKPGGEERFENAYGPAGDWVRLFRRDSHYHETRLVRDSFRPSVYLTMDFWESRPAY